MTWNEFNTMVWRAAGLNEEQIAAGLAHNDKEMPGHGESLAILKPGVKLEDAVADGVIVFRYYCALPVLMKKKTQAAIDAMLEADNRNN